VSEAAKPTFVKLALDDARIASAEKQEKFARLFNEHKALTPELLRALEKDGAFTGTEIADLRTSFQLTELTRGDFSVVKMLKDEFDVHQPEKIRALAKKSESEWVNLVKEKHAAGDIKLPIEVGEIAGEIEFPAAEVYGKTLARQFREAFPTTAFAGGLERAMQNGGAHGLPHAKELSKFLESHEKFEFLNTPVDDFLKNNINPDFRALADDENFRLEVKAAQRVFKLVPTFEATDALLADNRHSAQQIYRMGESEFVRRYTGRPGFTKESARLAWNRAADTHAAVLTIVADLKALEKATLPRALQTGREVIPQISVEERNASPGGEDKMPPPESEESRSKALSTFPNWDNLFQAGDLCECEHCRSVLGPAAYFADLLMFLKERYWKGVSVKDILFNRRPDLGYLELNCVNALTPLPYIDVVCEVLEDAVDATGENDLEFTGFTTMPGASVTAKQTVLREFIKKGISLGADFSFSQVNSLLTAVTGIGAYQAAIKELFTRPRLALKFFAPVFAAPLAILPAAVDFKTLPDPALALKISYDAEQRLLRFTGIMSKDEKAALNALSKNVNYRNAVDSLFTQPVIGVFPPEKIWLLDADLLFPLRNLAVPASDNLAKNLANANTKALAYLSKTLSKNAVVQQSSAQLGLTEAVTRRLLTSYAVVPILPTPTPPAPTKMTLMAHLTGTFADTTSVVDYATPAMKPAFDGWFWANRAAAIWKKWKITLEELDKLIALTAGANHAQLLDFLTLPLNDAGAIASLEEFLRTSRLLKMRDSLPEGEITLLEVLEKLNTGAYPAALEANVEGLPSNFVAFHSDITGTPNNIPIQYDKPKNLFRFTGLMTDTQRTTLLKDPLLGAVTSIATYQQAIEKLFKSPFAVDVERLNENWLADDVEALITSLDMTYPANYLLAESWERLRRAFYFLDNLNASANTVKEFAAPAMTDVDAKTIKELLRSKFGVETWLMLSTEIQDVLRERKRDALAAYLLTKPPAEAPTGKWENTNDLYAYYLLDVEMSSCQLTSRLVQASGSVQLFVQRCFMGLEPEVVVKADGDDGDSAWRWWKWMRKYRVWEANRKVFLWPENWIEPELKKDRSPFFKDMENELLQNEINQFTAETAFANYLEKLGGVAQLEIAGFFQEDDGGNTIVHVFGRTAGAEPHLYYYRRYDYRQWTPWEKVELDIQGDYLIPAVVNRRLFLFWPVFTEVPDEAGNSTVNVPTPGQTTFTPDKTKKRLRLQMA